MKSRGRKILLPPAVLGLRYIVIVMNPLRLVHIRFTYLCLVDLSSGFLICEKNLCQVSAKDILITPAECKLIWENFLAEILSPTQAFTTGQVRVDVCMENVHEQMGVGLISLRMIGTVFMSKVGRVGS